MASDLILRPHVSEKSFSSAQKGVYVFDVPNNANKHTVKQAVESQFKVKVTDIRTILTKGKPKRVIRKRQRPTDSHRSNVKKAYVTLKKGDKIAMISEGAA